MSDRPKARKKADSLWGDVARMEAEVYDPEEVETSVFDMDRIAELRKQAEVLIAQKRELASEQARQSSPAALAGADEDDDEEDDATSVFDSGPVLAAARRQRDKAVTEVAPKGVPVDDEPPELHTKIYSREPAARDDDTPSIVVSEELLDDDFDDELMIPDSAPEAVVDQQPASDPAPEEPVSEPVSEPAGLGALAAPEPSALRTFAPFVLLVILGFLVGYLMVSFL